MYTMFFILLIWATLVIIFILTYLKNDKDIDATLSEVKDLFKKINFKKVLGKKAKGSSHKKEPKEEKPFNDIFIKGEELKLSKDDSKESRYANSFNKDDVSSNVSTDIILKMQNNDRFFNESGKKKLIVPLEALVFLTKDLNPLVDNNGEIIINIKEEEDEEIRNLKEILITIRESDEVIYKTDEEIISSIRALFALMKKENLTLDKIKENIIGKIKSQANELKEEAESKIIKESQDMNVSSPVTNNIKIEEPVKPKIEASVKPKAKEIISVKEDIKPKIEENIKPKIEENVKPVEIDPVIDYSMEAIDDSDIYGSLVEDHTSLLASEISNDDIYSELANIETNGFDSNPYENEITEEDNNIKTIELSISDDDIFNISDPIEIKENDIDEILKIRKEFEDKTFNEDNNVEKSSSIKEFLHNLPFRQSSTIKKIKNFRTFNEGIFENNEDIGVFFNNLIKLKPIIFNDSKTVFFADISLIFVAYAESFGLDFEFTLRSIDKINTSNKLDGFKEGFILDLEDYVSDLIVGDKKFSLNHFTKENVGYVGYGIWFDFSVLNFSLNSKDLDFYRSYPYENGFKIAKVGEGNGVKIVKDYDNCRI